MATILVKAEDYTHPDPEIDYVGAWKKGYPVTIVEDGHEFGSDETLPKFVKIHIPSMAAATIAHYVRDWRLSANVSVVNSDLALDGHRLDVNITNANSVRGKLTWNRVENYINSWNGVFVSFAAATSTVRFDISVYGLATSKQFWGSHFNDLVFTEQSYTQAGGIHDIHVDFSAAPLPGNILMPLSERLAKRKRMVQQIIAHNGGVVLSGDDTQGVYRITRAAMRDYFVAELKEDLRDVACRREFYLPTALVDSAIAAGGEITIDSAALAGQIRSKVDD